MSNTIRLSGLATGMDTDTTVKQMMRPYNLRLDKMKQDRQIIQWRQDLYRDIIGSINTFRSSYFDVLKSDSYMLSSRLYAGFDTKSSDTSNSVVTVTASSGAVAGNYKIKDIVTAKTAKKTTASGSEMSLKEAGQSVKASGTLASKSFSITLDGGSSYSITLADGSYSSMDDLAGKINSNLADKKDSAGKSIIERVKAVASDDGMGIEFVPMVSVTKDNNTFTIEESPTKNYTLTVSEGSYSTKELVSILNSKIGEAKDDLGNRVLVDKVKVSLSDDGTFVRFDKIGSFGGAVKDKAGASILGSEYYKTSIAVSNDSSPLSKNKIIPGVNFTAPDIATNTTGNNELIFGSNSIRITQGAYTDLKLLVKEINDRINDNNTKPDNTERDDTDPKKIKVEAQLSQDGTRIQFKGTTNEQMSVKGSALSSLGFSTASTGTEMYPITKDRMSSLFQGDSAADGIVKFNINGKDFTYNFLTADKDKTIGTVMSEISARANVKLSYSELGRTFTIESSNTGSDQKITASETTTGFLKTLFGNDTFINIVGQDASVEITNPNNQTAKVTKTTNTFTIDGVTYNLLRDTLIDHDGNPDTPLITDPTLDSTQTEINMTLTANVQKPFDKIKEFVDKYNEMISDINSKIEEKKQYKYLPLTDEQKKEMKEDDIKAWEEKAKQGLLKGDTTLENLLMSMRTAFFQQVNGVNISASEIGLTTSSDTTERGKIIIDEAKLKDALLNKGDQVAQLFSKSSSIGYSPDLGENDRRARNSDIGIFQRINDAILDSVRTTRDKDGKKGLLLEKAGIKGDYSDVKNILSEDMKRRDKLISEMAIKLAQKENRFYQQFAQLEKAMNSLNAQSNWLMQQLGGGQ